MPQNIVMALNNVMKRWEERAKMVMGMQSKMDFTIVPCDVTLEMVLVNKSPCTSLHNTGGGD